MIANITISIILTLFTSGGNLIEHTQQDESRARRKSSELSYTRLTQRDLVRILNNFVVLKEFHDNDYFVRILGVNNPEGSAGISESSTSLYIAFSGDGEDPEQRVYRLTPVYDPSIPSAYTSQDGISFVLIFGPADQRESRTITATFEGLNISPK